MDEIELRKFALELAVKTIGQSTSDHILKVATEYYNFINNKMEDTNA